MARWLVIGAERIILLCKMKRGHALAFHSHPDCQDFISVAANMKRYMKTAGVRWEKGFDSEVGLLKKPLLSLHDRYTLKMGIGP